MPNADLGDGQAALERAWSSFWLGKIREAGQHVEKRMSLQPECGSGWMLRGLIRHARKQWRSTVLALEEASVRIPLTPLAVCALADAYREVGNNSWAKESYREVLRQDHTPAPLLRRVASGLDALDDPQLAVMACRRALALEPDSAPIYFELSYYLGRCGASTATIASVARRAVHLEPDNWKFRIGLAIFLQFRNRLTETAEILAPVELNQIRAMNCACCLERLLKLFEAINDQTRAGWCRTQLDRLPSLEETDTSSSDAS